MRWRFRLLRARRATASEGDHPIAGMSAENRSRTDSQVPLGMYLRPYVSIMGIDLPVRRLLAMGMVKQDLPDCMSMMLVPSARRGSDIDNSRPCVHCLGSGFRRTKLRGERGIRYQVAMRPPIVRPIAMERLRAHIGHREMSSGTNAAESRRVGRR
jgi:hypothetical protein